MKPPSLISVALLLLNASLAHAALSAGPEPALAPAFSALMQGRVDDVTHMLAPVVAANGSNPLAGRAHLLLCRAAYAEGQSQAAINECTVAVGDLPQDSEAATWLGRSLGQQAAHANPISAYKLAGRVRLTFEKAHALNPRDVHAAEDLASFYIQAPAMLGGNLDLAQALAQGLLSAAPATAHRLLGSIAEARKDFAGAEREFRQEISVNPATGWLDLALFFSRQKQYEQASMAVSQALAADSRLHGPVEVDAASLLMDMKRQPDAAERALQAYLVSPNQTDEAPAFRAHVMLGKLLQKRGDKTGAHTEYAAALALAAGYTPAQKALDSL